MRSATLLFPLLVGASIATPANDPPRDSAAAGTPQEADAAPADAAGPMLAGATADSGSEGSNDAIEPAAAEDTAPSGGPASSPPALPPLGALTARAGEDGFFALPTLRASSTSFPAATRDPFLFLDEERSGAPWERRLESPGNELDAAGTKPSGSDPTAEVESAEAIESRRRELVKRTLESSRVTAVLVATDGGSAIVNGDLVRVGSRIDATGHLLVAVSRRGVVVLVGDERVEIPLATRSPAVEPGAPSDAPAAEASGTDEESGS